ncbi:hypothetical protein SKM57_11295 [Acinetobacter faecalis]|uniref:hypothetical protein n=1 Tax=Acinetobacter faecalis TaxID=2665161 RepID=UPI002A90C65B|nr:hypothetical protein [Acinetobacter faecalis]MDY6469165.1 hypothetical protein [Acinetobacter faecalis]
MTDIQKNIAVANFIIDELHKDKPFVLKLDVEQTKAMHDIAAESWHIKDKFVSNLTIFMWVKSDKNLPSKIEVDKSNVDVIYHMLSSYIAKHGLPKSVVESLG